MLSYSNHSLTGQSDVVEGAHRVEGLITSRISVTVEGEGPRLAFLILNAAVAALLPDAGRVA